MSEFLVIIRSTYNAGNNRARLQRVFGRLHTAGAKRRRAGGMSLTREGCTRYIYCQQASMNDVPSQERPRQRYRIKTTCVRFQFLSLTL